MTVWLLAILMLINGTGCATSAPPIRVMSFNIRYGTASDGENHWDQRHELVAQTIRNFNPDLLGTQECLAFQADFLKEHFPGYDFHGVGRDDGSSTGEMTAIFYRTDRFERLDAGHFWLSETPEVPGSVSWDSALTRMCSWVKLRDRGHGGGELFFFNTHFDHRGVIMRRESARLLSKMIPAIAGDSPVILTGDFNAPAQSGLDEPYTLLTKNLADTYRTINPRPGPEEGTFGAFSGLTNGPRIDWILVTRHVRTIKAGIDRSQREGRYPSDHFPITAIVKP